MKFKSGLGNVSVYVEGKENGKLDFGTVNHSEMPAREGHFTIGESDWLEEQFLSAAIGILDDIAKHHPEVYGEVYHHIQPRTEESYVTLAMYCKKKNNEIARKLHIIE